VSSNFAIAGILLQKFEDRKIDPVWFVLRKVIRAKFNYDVYDKDMLAVVYSLKENHHFLQGAEHQATVYSDHQNIKYFKSATLLNPGQGRWEEEHT